MGDIGGFVMTLMYIAAFSVLALVAGAGLALGSIWLPITVWQASLIMAGFGCVGAFLVSRIK
ncbi:MULTISPECIES: hypothetical protein [unclassified Mesorhizobium]|uniref:hypothetical protein n=1 Tax=unclassified Mesorhizobium TaxID=325217 RepID=UPI000FDC6997|nr:MULTISPECIES: hypothetical protein [unclassified Mesorhizobium]TGT76147.1 hypothetical protein EN809_000540 [Mesorhizobium sp. M2E.F.Ca.ET.166.01.1.1]TGW02262.1 hypothetical protein EN797_000540 [Mesorhizobium sp. M2E.F.Ca.ET.154.01.1.1]